MNRYKAMAELDSYKAVEVTLEIPGQTLSLVSKNEFRGGMDFSVSFLLAHPFCGGNDGYGCNTSVGMTLEGMAGAGDSFDLKGKMYHATSQGHRGELSLKMSHDDRDGDKKSKTSLEVMTTDTDIFNTIWK